jgi:CRP-like cAMP-binding protein
MPQRRALTLHAFILSMEFLGEPVERTIVSARQARGKGRNMFRAHAHTDEHRTLDPNRSIALFDGIAEDSRAALLKTWFAESWFEGLGELDASHTLYLIEEGRVEITLPIGQGTRNVPVLIALGPGDFFGETRLLFPEPLARPRVVSSEGAGGRLLATGDAPSALEPLEQLVAAHPRLGANLVAEVCRRLLAASRFVPSHAAPLRLGYFLLGATTTDPDIEVSGTTALAAQLGLSGPAVTHALSALEGARLLGIDRGEALRIHVNDRELLAHYLGVALE